MAYNKSNEEKEQGSDARESAITKKNDDQLCSSLPVVTNGSSDLLQQEWSLDDAFRMVERDRIEIGPVVRLEVSEADIRALANNILEQKEQGHGIKGCGILQPLVVRPRTLLDGTIVPGYILVKGLRRLKASELAYLEYVPVQVMSADEENARLASIIITLTSKENSLRDRAVAIVETMEKYGYSVREMASKTGISKSVIDRAVQAIELPFDLRRAWELRPGAMEQLLLLRDVKNGDIRRRLIEAVTDTTVDEERGIRPLSRRRTKEIVEGIENVDALYQKGRLDDMAALFLKQNFISGRKNSAEQREMLRSHLGELSGDELRADEECQQRLAQAQQQAIGEGGEDKAGISDYAALVRESQRTTRALLGEPSLQETLFPIAQSQGASEGAQKGANADEQGQGQFARLDLIEKLSANLTATNLGSNLSSRSVELGTQFGPEKGPFAFDESKELAPLARELVVTLVAIEASVKRLSHLRQQASEAEESLFDPHHPLFVQVVRNMDLLSREWEDIRVTMVDLPANSSSD